MAAKRRNFRRKYSKRRYRKMFVISVEGDKTEPIYFGMLNNKFSTIKINCLSDKTANSPDKVLARIKDYLTNEAESFGKSDEAWLVVDKDDWSNQKLNALNEWTKKSETYYMALSNPKIEFWLLLHFEDGKAVSDSKSCSERLKKHIPDYKKAVNMSKFTEDRIANAIQRAKRFDNPPCKDWPKTKGTTVYRLVDRILNS